MGQLYVDTIEPQSATALTVGESGQNTVLPGNDLRANVVQDAGGNAIFTSNGSGTLSGVNSGFGAAMVLVSSTTLGSDTADVVFTMNSDYDHYWFKFYNAAPATNTQELCFDCSEDGTTYSTYKTSTVLWNYYNSGGGNALQYPGGKLSNATGHQKIDWYGNNGASAINGVMGDFIIYNPSASGSGPSWPDFGGKKQFMSRTAGSYSYSNDTVKMTWVAGYLNTSNAITHIKFKMSAGDIMAGAVFKQFGMK